MIDFYCKEYSDKKWNNYMSYIKSSHIKIKGIPQDVADALYHTLGNGMKEWINRPISALDGKTAVQLLASSDGTKALKAFIMRMPC
ncbi:MAG: DUF2384 domain-containing protein [Lachnospiraceae bacterium]|nr:DUF2384 domain-containing protein [Lachnospiraceae bacterium]